MYILKLIVDIYKIKDLIMMMETDVMNGFLHHKGFKEIVFMKMEY